MAKFACHHECNGQWLQASWPNHGIVTVRAIFAKGVLLEGGTYWIRPEYVAFLGSTRAPTRQGRSTGGCRGKSLWQGMDPAGRHAQDIPRRGGGSAGDPGRGVPTARHAAKGYPRAGRDAASALRRWQLRAVDVVRRRRSGGCHYRWAVQGDFRHARLTDGTLCPSLATGVECREQSRVDSLHRDDIIRDGRGFWTRRRCSMRGRRRRIRLVAASGGDGHESCGLAP